MSENDSTQLLIDAALREDLGEVGDLTTTYFVPEEARGEARIFAKQPCAISGIEVAERVLHAVDPDLEVEIVAGDGSQLQPGDTVLNMRGSLRSILTAERTTLNFLQQLSGVATMAQRFVELTQGTKAKILDTRKTTPAWRLLEKKAVADGGAVNHRMGLYDHVMVKDNHLLADGDLSRMQEGIRRVKADHPASRVQLEVDTLEQLRSFLDLEGVDSILLDNMSTDQLREAVSIRDAQAPAVILEASGGVNLDTVAGIAATGVDYISVGALTHSAPAVDLSLEIRLAE